MKYDIQLAQQTAIPLLVVTQCVKQSELAKAVPEACGIVWNVVRAQQIPGAGRHVAVYLDDQINVEIGVELESPSVGCGDVVGSATPAGLVASTVHCGPYGQL